MALHCTHLTCRMPLHKIWTWSPNFRIDALGLVTMIGAEQVNQAVGRLVTSRYTEYLPLLGAYVIASNGFTESYSGFGIYNISAGIMTTDMAGWFARWCLAQEFPRACSSVRWTVEQDWDPKDRRDRLVKRRRDTLLALAIGVIINGTLLAFTTLQGDWWGLVNAASMAISIAVRWYVTKRNRHAIDKAVRDRLNSSSTPRLEAKCFITFNDGKQINLYAPQSLVKWVFIDKPVVKESPKSWYFMARTAGWIAFAGHVITIGQSGLATQIVTVFVLVVSTVMTLFKVGCDDNMVGSMLHAGIVKSTKEFPKRRDAFIQLELTEGEEKLMRKWSQMPLRHIGSDENQGWWDNYYEHKRQAHPRCYAPMPAPAPLVSVSPPASDTKFGFEDSNRVEMQAISSSVASAMVTALAPKPAKFSTSSVSSGSSIN